MSLKKPRMSGKPRNPDTQHLLIRLLYHSSILSLIRGYPIGRRNFLLITFNWLANSMVYNGLSYYSANLNVSSHLGFFIRQVSIILISRKHLVLFTNLITKEKYQSRNTMITLECSVWSYSASILMMALLMKVLLQFCCGDPFLFHRLVHHGQVGQEVDPLRHNDDRRPLLYLLHVCSSWWV